MKKEHKERLYNKIRAKYDLPDKVAGADVEDALSFQCSNLYRQWRFRLKEQHYQGHTKAQSRRNRPLTIDEEQWYWLVDDYWGKPDNECISKINRENKLKRKETTANGSKSTARFFYDMINEPTIVSTQNLEGTLEPIETQQEPIYIRLFEKTKKHKKLDGSTGWEPNAEKNYEELKKLHETQIEEHGEDTLTVEDAYIKVLKPTSSSIRGLGPGSRPPKKGRTKGGDNQHLELSTQVDTLTTSNEELRASNEDLRASNEELKSSNEELKASNEELKAEFARMNKEALERENKIREDMLKMFESIRNNRA